MKFLKNMMQIGLAVFFFVLLAISKVFANDADSEGWQFFQENGRTYYKKGDVKETAWRVIDGKTYYFDYNGEMVVGWHSISISRKYHWSLPKWYEVGIYANVKMVLF